MEELTHDQIADVIEMPTQTYYQRMIALFTSGRAMPEHWDALERVIGEDVLHDFQTGQVTAQEWVAAAIAVHSRCVSEHGAQVASIDRAVLAMGEG